MKWESVPFRNPIHPNLDYVYTVDQDAGLFIISLWKELNGVLRPKAIRIDLAELCASSRLFIKHSLEQPTYMIEDSTCRSKPPSSERLAFGALDINLGIPTPMNELQERFFTDFVFIWRHYIDDHLTWRYSSAVFRVLSIAFLRLAAWDFELSPDDNAELPISFASIPSWTYPKTDIYWFHGFLVVLQESVESDAMIDGTLKKVKSYTNDYGGHRDMRLILMSPHHVTFVELSHGVALASKSIVLLNSFSAVKCSPGFRALARIMTSNCWKKSVLDREKWKQNIPTEILHKIIHELEPRDTVAFSQASFIARQCYYNSIPQVKDTVVLRFDSSIPCCGIRGDLEENGACCLQCFSWQHVKCLGAESRPFNGQFICINCLQTQTSATFVPGDLNSASCRQSRKACQIRARGLQKSLHLRLSKPSHLRKDLRFLGNLVSVEPCLIDYTILFNRSFSGLAYGMENGF